MSPRKWLDIARSLSFVILEVIDINNKVLS
jgi:hypothetical protein